MAAGDATARATKRTKLNADIMMLQNKVKDTKKNFGLTVYDEMVAANRPEVERMFMETRTKIEALEADIAAKRQQVEALKEPGTPRRLSSASGDPPPAGPPPTHAAQPPAGPPPETPAGPPPGWAVTKTAEGKASQLIQMPFVSPPCPRLSSNRSLQQEYFYNESTGETSWSLPIS